MKTLHVFTYLIVGLSLTSMSFLTGCTRKTEGTSTLTLKFPGGIGNSVQKIDSKFVSSKSVAISTTNGGDSTWNVDLKPGNIADVNCYAVFVSGPEPEMQKNSCKKEVTAADGTSTSSFEFRFGPHVAFLPKNSEAIQFEVPSGPARTIHLVGLKGQTDTDTGEDPCKIIDGQEPDFANLSTPQVIGSITRDLFPGDIPISITAKLDAAKEFDNCDIHEGGGEAVSKMFGDGRDGDLVVDNDGTYHPTHLISSMGTTTTTTSRFLSSSFRVKTIGATPENGENTLLTLDSSFTAADFVVGDEVLWHVDAAKNLTSCGAGLEIGAFGTARITEANPGTTIKIDTKIGSGGINGLQLIEPNPSATGNDFCRIQLLRVPNFNRVTINNDTTIESLDFDLQSSGEGRRGILAMRIKELVINNGKTLTINATGKGFAGGQGGGSSELKKGIGAHGIGAINGNGGAGDHISGPKAGGGGHIGQGGNSDSDAAKGGKSVPNSSYSIVQDKVFFFGGGGGGGSSSFDGGAGGGAILLHIGVLKTNAVPGILDVKADGTDGGDSIAGGGAGGAVHLSFQENSGVTINLDAKGGDSPPTVIGGGGGGGLIEVRHCDDHTNTSISTINTAGGAGFNIGGNGSSTAVVDAVKSADGDICSHIEMD